MRIRRAIASLAALVIVAIAAYVWRANWHAPARNTSAGTATWTAVPEQTLSHGRFANLTVYAPDNPPRGFVLLLSGADGWTPGMTETARQFVRQGAMVAGIDTRQLAANLEADDAGCVFPDGDLENLSHFVQAYYRLPAYLPPILAGKALGAALAYATLAQAPAKTFGGALSIGFCPAMALRKSLCKSGGLDFDPAAHGVDLLPAKQLADSWVVVDEPDAQSAAGIAPTPPASRTPPSPPDACDAAAIRHFVAQVPGAQFIQPGGTAGGSGAAQRPAPYTEAIDALLRKNETHAATVPPALGDLPIVAVPAQPGTAPSDIIAIMLSGDGGWAGLDKDVATALAGKGLTVVGLDSLRYFWSPRTPEGLAADLDRMVKYYLAEPTLRRVLLIGYSQGADVLPFALNRLSDATRSHVILAAVMGLSEHALFEFHLTSWISNSEAGPATQPEVDRIIGIPVLCIYGSDEDDSLCPRLDPHKVTVVKLKGGHHFDGDYGALAQAILASAALKVP
jgi:type IV secretory pathway VirJ component